MEQRVNDHHIRMQAVDSRRQHQIVRSAATFSCATIARVRSRTPTLEFVNDARHAASGTDGTLCQKMPPDMVGCAGFRVALPKGLHDPLRAEVNLAAVIACQPLDQVRKRALRPGAGGPQTATQPREPQVSVSNAAQVALTARQPRTAPTARASEAGTARPAAAKDRHSKGNLRKTESPPNVAGKSKKNAYQKKIVTKPSGNSRRTLPSPFMTTFHAANTIAPLITSQRDQSDDSQFNHGKRVP